MRTAFIFVPVVFPILIAASACAASLEVERIRRPEPTSVEHAATSCPLGVDGGSVEVTDVEGGAAMTFTAPERAEEVRERVRRAAEMRGPGERKGVGHDGTHQQGQPVHHGLQAWSLPPARIQVVDVEQGARLELLASFPSDVERLRVRVRERGEVMMACR